MKNRHVIERIRWELDQEDIRLDALFRLFLESEVALGEITPNETGAESDAEKLLDAQADIMAAAAKIPASDLRDVMFKLAIWRWDSSDLDQQMEAMHRGDAVVFSAFCDLAAMSGEVSVMKPIDRAHRSDSAEHQVTDQSLRQARRKS